MEIMRINGSGAAEIVFYGFEMEFISDYLRNAQVPDKHAKNGEAIMFSSSVEEMFRLAAMLTDLCDTGSTGETVNKLLLMKTGQG